MLVVTVIAKISNESRDSKGTQRGACVTTERIEWRDPPLLAIAVTDGLSLLLSFLVRAIWFLSHTLCVSVRVYVFL